MSQRSFLRDITGVFGSNMLALVSAFMMDIILSRQLGPEGRGLYTAVLVVPMITVSFALLGIRRSAIYHLGRKNFEENRIVSGIFSLMIFSSVLAIVISGIALYFTRPEGLTFSMAVITLLSIPVKMALVYSGGIFIGKEEFRPSNLQVWLPHFLNLIGIVLFVILLDGYVTGALLSLFAANLLVSIHSMLKLIKRYTIRIGFDQQVIRSLISLGISYALVVVVMQLNYRVDILLLQELSTMKEVGYYSLGVAISDKLWQLPSAIGLVVMSRSANTYDETRLNQDVARLLRLALLAVLITAVLLWLVAPLLIPLIFGSKFIPSITIVRWMLPGIVMFVIARILSGRFAGKGEPLTLAIIFIPALLLNILLNFLWIPSNGGLGAAWASNVSYSLGAIALLITFSVRMRINITELLFVRASDFNFLARIPKRFSKR